MTLIQMFEEFYSQNPQLQHIYDEASVTSKPPQSESYDTDEYSRLDATESHSNQSVIQNIVIPFSPNGNPSAKTGTYFSRQADRAAPTTSLDSTLTLVGDLTVRKGMDFLL